MLLEHSIRFFNELLGGGLLFMRNRLIYMLCARDEMNSDMRTIEIQNPVIKLLKSSPSSFGTICFHMVLFDTSELPEFESKIEVLSEDIDDEDNHFPFFLLHSTTTRGEPIVPLIEERKEQSQFTLNRTNTDSVLRYYCLADKAEGDSVLLKSGFHSWQAAEKRDERMPVDWKGIDNMEGGTHFLVNLQKERFWPIYTSALIGWFKMIEG